MMAIEFYDYFILVVQIISFQVPEISVWRASSLSNC